MSDNETLDNEPQFKNSQSRNVKYLSVTDLECRVCQKDKMNVKNEVAERARGTLTQHLECPTCGEAYPRVVSEDRKTVFHDPFDASRKPV